MLIEAFVNYSLVTLTYFADSKDAVLSFCFEMNCWGLDIDILVTQTLVMMVCKNNRDNSEIITEDVGLGGEF